MSEFGSRMCIAGFGLRGSIDNDHAVSVPRMQQFARDIVDAIGMHCSHPPQVTDYPAVGDVPSPGFIITQPIIESAILLDVWPRLDALYAHVVSCRYFRAEALYNLFERWGFEVTGTLLGGLQI